MSAEVLQRDFHLAFRNVLRQRRRALFALTIIAGGIIAFMLSGGFIQWLLDRMRESTIRSQLGHIQIVRHNYFDTGIADPYSFLLPQHSHTENLVREHPNVVTLTPRLSFTGLASLDEGTTSFVGDGVDPEGEEKINLVINIVEGNALSRDDPTGVILGQGLAANLGAKVGDRMVVMSTTAFGGLNALDVIVRGLFVSTVKAYDDSALRAPIELARKLVRVEGATTWVVLLDDTQKTSEILMSLTEKIDAKEYQLVPWHDLADFYNKTATLFLRQVLVVKIMIALIITLSISNTLSMSVMERTSEIGTAMALGIRQSGIWRLFVLEGLMLGLVGGAIGTSVGWVLAEIISTFGIPMPPPPGMAHGFTASILITPKLAFDAWLLAIIATLLASLFPAWKASRMVIVDAIRHQR